MELHEGYIVQSPGGQGRAVVRFVGTTKFKEGIWVGLELDEPKGKNNGEVQGVRYFTCEDKHGLFVKLQDIPQASISPPDPPTSTSSTPTSPATPIPSPIPSIDLDSTEQEQEEQEEQEEQQEQQEQEQEQQEQQEEQREQEEQGVQEEDVQEEREEQEEEHDEQQEEAQPTTPDTSAITSPATPPITPPESPPTTPLNAPPTPTSAATLTLPPTTLPSSPPPIKKEQDEEEEPEELMGDVEDADGDEDEDAEVDEKESSTFQARIDELEESLEMVSLDKEIAEAKVEELEQRLAELSASEQMHRAVAQASNVPVSMQQYNELVIQNEELRTALGTLRDLSRAEHEEYNNTKAAYAKMSGEYEALKQEADTVRQTLEYNNTRMEEMEQAVDDASAAQQIVEQLTDKCLHLEEEITDLKATLEEAGTLRELSDEVEAHHLDVERILQTQIQDLEAAAVAQDKKIIALQDRFNDSMRTIEQFRGLVQAQQDQLAAHEQKAGELAEKASTLMSESRVLMDQNIQLQAKTHKMRLNAIEGELLKLDQVQAKDHRDALLAMIPPSFLTIDTAPHHLSLLLKRIIFKSQLICATLQKEADVSEEEAARSEGYTWVDKVSFMAKLLLFFMDHYPHALYLRAGQSTGEIVGVENAYNACIALLSHRDATPTLASFETQSTPAIALAASRMETAIGLVLAGDDVGYPFTKALALHKRVAHLCHSTAHALASSQQQHQDMAAAELYSLQSVWSKITRCMETGAKELEELEGLERACETGQSILDRLAQNEGTEWLEEEVQKLFRDVANLVDACSLNVPAFQDNHKKSSERVKIALAEAGAVALKLAEALEKQKELQDALELSQISFEETKRDLREKDEQLRQAVVGKSKEKEAEEKELRLKTYDEQLETLQKIVDVTSADLTKAKARTHYLEGKVRELMEISAKQKKQLAQQLQIFGSPTHAPDQTPITASEDERQVFNAALKHLYLKCAKLKGELVAATIPRLFVGSQFANCIPHNPTHAMALFSQLPPLAPTPLPRDIQSSNASGSLRDPQLHKSINTWLRSSARTLANVRVVDLAAIKTGKSTGTDPLRELCSGGTRLHTRTCNALASPNFHENTMGQYLPPHITKIAAETQKEILGTITFPDTHRPSAYDPTYHFRSNLSWDQWKSVHMAFC